MKIAVVELDSYSLKYENTLAVARALLECGVEVKMWNPNTTAFLDMVYEVKPDIIFYTSELTVSDRAKKKAITENSELRFVRTDVFADMVIADTTAFKKIDPHPLFAGGEVCILQYPEIEDSENIVLKTRMSSRFTEQFRLFSVKTVSGAKFCGWIPKEMHPLIFSSAKSVLALSKQTAVNALLCNDNVKLVNDDSFSNFTMSDDELKAISSTTIAESYINA